MEKAARWVAFSLLLWSSLFAFDAAASELTPLRIGLTRDSRAAPLLIAVAGDYFRAEGLEARLTFLPSDTAVSAAVASGKADIGLASVSGSFYGFAAMHKLKMIASRSSDQTGFPIDALLIGAKAHVAGFTDLRGLAGKRIGIADNEAGATYALFAIAARFGLDFASMKIVPTKSNTAALTSLSRGEIDAALLPYRTALRSIKRGQSLLILSDFAGWQEGAVFTAATTIATRRNLIARFMRAYQRGTADYSINFLQYDDAGDFIPGPDHNRYLDAIAREVKLPPDLLSKTKVYCDRRGNLDAADIERQVRFWQDEGRLDKRIVAADLIDLSFIGEEPQPSPLQR